jgi:prolyl oligopeptidase
VTPRYPHARRDELIEHLHGRPVADPYRRLEDAHAPATMAWLAGQRFLVDSHLAGTPELKAFRRLLATADAAAGPVGLPRWGGTTAFTLERRSPSADAALLARDGDGATRVVVDPATLDPERRTTLASFAPSAAGRFVAYQSSRDGTDETTLTVVETRTGHTVTPPIRGVRHTPVAWRREDGFFYTRYREGQAEVRFRELPGGHDTSVFGTREPGARFGLAVWYDRWLSVAVRVGATATRRLLLADLATTGPSALKFVPVNAGTGGSSAVTLAVGRDGRLYVRTTRDAPCGRLVTASVADPDREEPLLPEDPGWVLGAFAVLDGQPPPRLVVVRTRAGCTELNLHDAATGDRVATFPLSGSVGGLSVHPDGRPACWLAHSDPVTPPRLLHLDTRTAELTGAGADVPAIDARACSVTYPSADGTEVPMTVLMPVGARPGRPRPAVVTGYGGFGYAIPRRYHPEAAAWVAAGGIWATAGLRGGGELGAHWHRAGRGANKPKAVADLHAAADWLVEQGLTARDRLALLGTSNGGLVAAAALVERPAAYAAVACVAAPLDMVRYDRYGLGALWRAEYGDPSVPEELDWLLSYSPYHRIAAGRRYPPTLLVTFAGDARVDPVHGRKMCAALQHADSGAGPVLLHAVDDLGHGAKPADSGLDIAATVLGFLARHTGLRYG